MVGVGESEQTGNQRILERLNVLIIITDQHNVHALGCYGNDAIDTPNLDRLAAQGIVFDNAITPSGACRPAKMSIFTGLHPRTHGLLDGRAETPKGWQTLGEIFRDAGYRTGLIGKHHMPDAVQTFGFEALSRGPSPRKGGPESGGRVGPSRLPNEEHSTGVIATDTMTFIDDHVDEPFFLISSQFAPHRPIFPSEPWASRHDPATIAMPPNHDYAADRLPGPLETLREKSAEMHEGAQAETLAYYYGLVSQVDHNIGRLIDRLDHHGLLEKTVILFLSDHGEMMGEHGAWTKDVFGYDAVVRIPLIWRLPGGEQGGTRRTQLASSLDVMPTLLDLTGLSAEHAMEGRSLVPELHDASVAGPEFDVSELFGVHNAKFCSTVRTDRWKYFRIASPDAPADEYLFDLAADPWEMRDLSTSPDARAALDRCRNWLDGWQRETGMCEMARAQLAGSGFDPDTFA